MKLVSLGDSFSCGEGVGLRVDLGRTWVGQLAAGMPDVTWTPLAVAGARVRDVRALQLPSALAERPDLATVLVGLNDVVRAGFVAADVNGHLREVVGALRAQGARVLLVRLHDPAALVPLGPLGRALAARVAVLCRAADELGTDPGVHVLDLGAVTALRQRQAWAVDRIHPSTAGHRAMAVAAAALLRRSGVPVRLPRAGLRDQPPSTVAQVRWLLAHGLPWTTSHLRSVALPLLGTVVGVSPRQPA